MMGLRDTIEFPVPPCSNLADCLLRRAAALGRAESARLLLNAGARLNIDESEWRAEGGLTSLGSPLVNACEAGHLEMVRLLLDEQADVNAMTQCNHIAPSWGCVLMDFGPLHAACAWGNLDIVKLLINEQASVGMLCRYSEYSESDTVVEGPTAFHLACARGHSCVVAFLHEECGCDVEAPAQLYGFTLAGCGVHYEDYNEPTFGWSVTDHALRQTFEDPDAAIFSESLKFPYSYGLCDGG